MPTLSPPTTLAAAPLTLLAATLLSLPFATNAADAPASPAAADPAVYLAEITQLCSTAWPKNRTVNIVCHGHSVPAGYFKTPEVRSLDAYPHLLRVALANRFPHAVINVIVTAIGGENSEGGAKRFHSDVLMFKPDLVMIDYSLNDRAIGLERAQVAWSSMIESALAKGIKVICLTPTPDLAATSADLADPLNQHAEQVRRLAAKYHVGLVDSLRVFEKATANGAELSTLMSQGNHPNRRGHELVGKELMDFFR